MAAVVLQPGRERSLARRHPWIFSGAIARVEGVPGLGETVEIRSAGGEALGLGAWSPQSQIAVRVWSFDPAQVIDASFFHQRLAAAVGRRARLGLLDPGLTGLRLVNAESDGLPGLVVDRYADWLVVQCLSAGAEAWRAEIAAGLRELVPGRGIYERSDVDVRRKEGLESRSGVLWGEPPPPRVEILEHGARFWVDLAAGHKTGFYLDQRDNRRLAGDRAAGREVLNCFAYTGGFTVTALRGGAAGVTEVESSGAALDLAARNLELNGLPAERREAVEGDVFQVLRRFRDMRRAFDLIVLDPPKFAEARSQLERATRGYKDINLLALKLLRPGGLLFTFSCSGLVTPDLFQKIVAGAAQDSGREVQMVQRLWQAADHPVALGFPEGEYLKGLVCAVD